jgi:hypothetical protein
MQGSCAVFNRSMSLMSAAGAVVLLPLALHNSASTSSNTAAAKIVPVTIVVRVMTATSALNLAALSPADFGDADATQ